MFFFSLSLYIQHTEFFNKGGKKPKKTFANMFNKG